MDRQLITDTFTSAVSILLLIGTVVIIVLIIRFLRNRQK